MRFKDKETVVEALEAWKRLRDKVEREGGEHYDKPVLVQFLDTNTYEVMDRDIVEDEFYVLRKYRVLRDLNAAGADLEDAIRSARGAGGKPQGRSQRPHKGQRPRTSQRGGRSQRGGKPKEPRGDKAQPPDGKPGGPRRRRRRRGPRRGNKPPQT